MLPQGSCQTSLGRFFFCATFNEHNEWIFGKKLYLCPSNIFIL